MLEAGPPQRDPGLVSREELALPAALDRTFTGFEPEAFAILDRLRDHPHIEQYRQEKDAIERYLKAPFKRYRDDLVVNWVLPNRLAFETERNVFSRLLKNDFGAGGCHHHLWMSFYRPPRRRLTDFQLAHSISPEGFHVGLYVGDYATDLVRQAKARIAAEPSRFLGLLDAFLATGHWRFHYYVGPGEAGGRELRAPVRDVPEELSRAVGLWAGRRFERDAALAAGGTLVEHALQALLEVWPLYGFYAADPEHG